MDIVCLRNISINTLLTGEDDDDDDDDKYSRSWQATSWSSAVRVFYRPDLVTDIRSQTDGRTDGRGLSAMVIPCSEADAPELSSPSSQHVRADQRIATGGCERSGSMCERVSSRIGQWKGMRLLKRADRIQRGHYRIMCVVVTCVYWLYDGCRFYVVATAWQKMT